jgi:hypothetical protein
MSSINRRRLLSSALALPAGARVGFSRSPAPDPMPSLIAEENRIRWLAIADRGTPRPACAGPDRSRLDNADLRYQTTPNKLVGCAVAQRLHEPSPECAGTRGSPLYLSDFIGAGGET